MSWQCEKQSQIQTVINFLEKSVKTKLVYSKDMDMFINLFVVFSTILTALSFVLHVKITFVEWVICSLLNSTIIFKLFFKYSKLVRRT